MSDNVRVPIETIRKALDAARAEVTPGVGSWKHADGGTSYYVTSVSWFAGATGEGVVVHYFSYVDPANERSAIDRWSRTLVSWRQRMTRVTPK